MGRRKGAEKPRRRQGGVGLTLTLAALAAAGAVALGYVGFVLWPRWPAGTADVPSLPITVGGVIFNVPPAAIRTASQRAAGTQLRLDLAFRWPDLTPPALGTKPQLSEELKPNHLFVTIAGSQGTLPLMERIRTIYPRYTGSTAFAGPAGLTGVPFRDGTPYQGEDLLLDPERPEDFVVRCTRASGPMTGMCLLERHLGEAEITVRFPRDWLTDWRAVKDGSDSLIAQLHAVRPKT